MGLFHQRNYYQTSPNKNVKPLATTLSQEGEIKISGYCLTSLAYKYGTPLYILDENTIRTSCKAYFNTLKNFYPGSSLPLYASKANSCKALSAIVASEGFGLDVVSAGELLTAIHGGMPPKRILLHGNNKSLHELTLALKHKTAIVVDNFYELYTLAQLIPDNTSPALLMLRITPGIECHTHDYIRTGKIDSKFGFSPNEIESVLRWLISCPWAKVIGLHAHIGSQIFELEPHHDLVSIMIDIIKMGRMMGHPLTDLNVGGGLGVSYINRDRPPSIQLWVKTIAKAVVEGCKESSLHLPRLLCEPGRSLIATSGITLYTLGSRKFIPGKGTYISVDGGMSDNPRPITYQSLYSSCLVNHIGIESTELVTLVGKHCESGDVLLKNLEIPLSNPGDILVIFGTGAYNMSMSSNYNRVPRPSTILISESTIDLIQSREQPDDLLSNDILPLRLLNLYQNPFS